jgi:hypothetical protein
MTAIKIEVERLPSPSGAHGDGLHWFRIDLAGGQGRCFITTGEALHLRQLTTDWVERALANLALQKGLDWIQEAASGSSGLMLHHSDACDLWTQPSREARSDPITSTGRETKPWA